MEQEIFKPIEGYEGLYEIGSYGSVKSLAKEWSVGRKEESILKFGKRGEYLCVVLAHNRIKKPMNVHRLVAKYFCDNPFGYEYVNHIDLNKLNNYYKNLEWTTISGNAIHAFKMGARKPMKGESNPQSRLTEQDVLRIRELYNNGMAQREIGLLYNMRQNGISKIVLRNRWKHI